MGISIWQLLIVLLIIVLLFGSKKLRGLGTDLGSALRGFKKELHEEKDDVNQERVELPVEQKAEQKKDADFAKDAKRERDDEPAGRD